MSGKCPGCGVHGTAVALTFHIRRDHPVLVEYARAFLNDLSRAERKVARIAAESTEPPALVQLYKDGCPCGRDYRAHMEVAASMGRFP
jgi:hypothetical protein